MKVLPTPTRLPFVKPSRYAEEYELIALLQQGDFDMHAPSEQIHLQKRCQTLQSRLGFEDVLAAPRLRDVQRKLGSETTERLLLWALLHGWPAEVQDMDLVEKKRFVRRLTTHYYGESVKDVVLAGLYVRVKKIRKSKTAGYLLALFQIYLDTRAQYVERKHQREAVCQEQNAVVAVENTLTQFPKLMPLLIPRLFSESA